ncbi:MAG: adenylate kinase, partial [Deltaproteobacteria bacterium]|nr:adenylate kinase [Deltaproteobacteria bacterium]
GSPVIQRDDETEEAILNRLETYNEKTAPLIGFYEGKGLLRNFVSLSSKDTVGEIKKSIKD